MIALDTNILVFAHRRDSDFHDAAAGAVRTLAEGRARFAIPWPCLHEFLAIVTHPRIYDPPSPLEAALDQVDAWIEAPRVVLLTETPDHWDHLTGLVRSGRATGPIVHDARIAALCQAHGISELWTADRDFTRFPGVKTLNPLV